MEGKNEEQLKSIKNQEEKQLDVTKDWGKNKLKRIKRIVKQKLFCI